MGPHIFEGRFTPTFAHTPCVIVYSQCMLSFLSAGRD